MVVHNLNLIKIKIKLKSKFGQTKTKTKTNDKPQKAKNKQPQKQQANTNYIHAQTHKQQTYNPTQTKQSQQNTILFNLNSRDFGFHFRCLLMFICVRLFYVVFSVFLV
jgi:hypothetical protein